MIAEHAYLPQQSAAVPIIAERISLPSSAASVPLQELLPPPLAALYGAPSPELLPPAAASAQRRRRTRAIVRGARSEYVALVRRMCAVGMLDFTTQPRCVNGVFGVPKPDGAIRLIIDARPANAVFAEPPHVELPTPDLIANLVAARRHALRGKS